MTTAAAGRWGSWPGGAELETRSGLPRGNISCANSCVVSCGISCDFSCANLTGVAASVQVTRTVRAWMGL
ncbi:hypothetical protein [Streptomyces sp. TLI_185]|uniref:hypothetical protein n=1 Tax=Streptomyces sp. TLI_185 TaxID=2485151 RepID=UPI000F5131E6|nr:hypothetical protein [Streptomyces sp. TLI_185]